jgi:hypothetical protein
MMMFNIDVDPERPGKLRLETRGRTFWLDGDKHDIPYWERFVNLAISDAFGRLAAEYREQAE